MENIIVNEYVQLVVETLVYITVSFFMLYLSKKIYTLFNFSVDVKNELVEKDNFAFAVAHVGYFAGIVIVIGSVLAGDSRGLMRDVIDMLGFGMLSILLLNLSLIINDRLILKNFSVQKEIVEDRNVGTGVIEAASSIASGLIIYGAVTGDANGSYAHQFVSAILFWLIGQVVLIITARIYDLITPYSFMEHIEKDNVAVGVGFSGSLVALSILIHKAISGDFISWSESFQNLLVYVVIGLALLPILRSLSDKILLPGRKITDELINQEKPNVGAGLVEAFSYIGGALLVSWCL